MADFRGANSRYFIAATVDLLSTGVDVPRLRNVVFFRYVRSPISYQGRYVLGTEGGRDQIILFDVYKQRLAAQLLAEAPTLSDFRARWAEPDERRALIDKLVRGGHPPTTLQAVQQMADYDLYDVLGDLGFHIRPRTRQNRVQAFLIKHEDWLDGLPPQTAAAIRAIVAQFEHSGTDGLESKHVFAAPAFRAAGGFEALEAGGDPAALVREAKERMFAA